MLNMENENLIILPWRMENEYFMESLWDIDSEEAMVYVRCGD